MKAFEVGLNPLKIGSYCNMNDEKKKFQIIVSIPLKSGHIVIAHKIGLLKQFYEKLQKIFFLKIS